MNRDQKAAVIAEIAAQIDESQAVFAVDYKGISVPQAAELRARLRGTDATFKVVKNSLTERAADQAGAEALKALLEGPTALTFVRGDAATAAKAIADYGRTIQLLPFKGGLMDGAPLEAEQIRALSRLPSREALYGQLVGMVASPIGGLVRTLNALLGGLAVALGQVHEKKESGDIPSGEAPQAAAPAAQQQPSASEQPTAAPERAPTDADSASGGQAQRDEAKAAESDGENQAEAKGKDLQTDEDDQADASVHDQPETAEANPTKED